MNNKRFILSIKKGTNIQTGTFPAELSGVEFSIDGGASFNPWPGPLNLGTMAGGASQDVIIRGTADTNATAPIVNTAEVNSATPDPNPENNISTVTTNIFGPRCQAIVDLIESVALQETALAHILNAEGEKMQAMLNMQGMTAQRMLAFNNSVIRLIRAAVRLEMLLQAKFETVSGGLKDC